MFKFLKKKKETTNYLQHPSSYYHNRILDYLYPNTTSDIYIERTSELRVIWKDKLKLSYAIHGSSIQSDEVSVLYLSFLQTYYNGSIKKRQITDDGRRVLYNKKPLFRINSDNFFGYTTPDDMVEYNINANTLVSKYNIKTYDIIYPSEDVLLRIMDWYYIDYMSDVNSDIIKQLNKLKLDFV